MFGEGLRWGGERAAQRCIGYCRCIGDLSSKREFLGERPGVDMAVLFEGKVDAEHPIHEGMIDAKPPLQAAPWATEGLAAQVSRREKAGSVETFGRLRPLAPAGLSPRLFVPSSLRHFVSSSRCR